MAYLLQKMLTYDDDQTFEHEFTILEEELIQNISIKDMGVYQFQNIVKFSDEGYPEPLFYNETTMRYVNMSYVVSYANWLEEDPKKTYQY